jgi:hypothetical protein
VISTLIAGPNLRQAGFPWAASSGAALAAVTTAALRRRHGKTWSRAQHFVASSTVLGLLGVAAFFAALGIEDLTNAVLGLPRFLGDNAVVTALGTLAASLLAMVIVPIGLLLLGVFTIRARALDRSGRFAMAAIGPILIVGAVLTGTTGSMWVAVTWPLLLGGCWAAVGLSLLRRPAAESPSGNSRSRPGRSVR